jgi:hypothetical protein
MTIKILSEGKLPPDITYYHSCKRCGTTFTFNSGDGKNIGMVPREDSYSVICPFCSSFEIMNLEKCVVPQHTESNEQKLIDLMFEIGIKGYGWGYDCHSKNASKKNNEQIADWIAKGLMDIGFETTPIGSSWGKLKTK